MIHAEALWKPLAGRRILEIKSAGRKLRPLQVSGVSLNIDQLEPGWLKADGKPASADDQLTIAELLEELGARKAAEEAFPWVKATTAHWFVFLLASRGGRRPLEAVRRYLDDPELRASAGARAPGGTRRAAAWDAHWVHEDKLETLGISVQWHRLSREVYKHVVWRREPVPGKIARQFWRMWIRQSTDLATPARGRTTWGAWLSDLAGTESDGIDHAARRFVERCNNQRAPDHFMTLAASYSAIRALYGEDLEGDTGRTEIKRWARLSLSLLKRMTGRKVPPGLLGHLERARRHGEAILLQEARRIRGKKRTPVYRTFRLWLYLRHCQKLNRALKSRS